MCWGVEKKICTKCGKKFMTDKIGTLNRVPHTECPECRKLSKIAPGFNDEIADALKDS